MLLSAVRRIEIGGSAEDHDLGRLHDEADTEVPAYRQMSLSADTLQVRLQWDGKKTGWVRMWWERWELRVQMRSGL